MGEKRPIIFIIIDALRTDAVGSYNSIMSTPNIDALAHKGILFQQAYACTNHTNPSLTSIFSGRFPMSHGIVHQLNITRKELLTVSKVRFLAEILKSNGYTTLGVDFLSRWHKRGFDSYVSGFQRNKSIGSILDFLNECAPSFAKFPLRYLIQQARFLPYPSAAQQTDMAISLIRRYHATPFFLFVHYWDTHMPYSPPSRFVGNHPSLNVADEHTHSSFSRIVDLTCYHPVRKILRDWMSGQSLRSIISRYLGAVAFVDYEIGRILTALRENRISDNALVVLTADHGESLGEHGLFFGHYGLYDVTIHVPLVFYDASFSHKTCDGFVQHTDVVPSILDILGFPYKSSLFDGKSMIPLVEKGEEIHQAVLAEESPVGVVPQSIAIRTKDYKYIKALSTDLTCKYCNRLHIAAEELYDMNEDSKETHNLAYERPETAIAYKKMLKNMSEKLGHKVASAEGTAFEWSKEEEEMKHRLRRLGYID